MEKKTKHTNRIFYERRKELRNNATPEENMLWQYLRRNGLGYKFQRQHSIGPYIADFFCASRRLIIEIDGSQHLENEEYDTERTNYLTTLDYKVLRFWNNEIKINLEGVLMKIKEVLKS